MSMDVREPQAPPGRLTNNAAREREQNLPRQQRTGQRHGPTAPSDPAQHDKEQGRRGQEVSCGLDNEDVSEQRRQHPTDASQAGPVRPEPGRRSGARPASPHEQEGGEHRHQEGQVLGEKSRPRLMQGADRQIARTTQANSARHTRREAAQDIRPFQQLGHRSSHLSPPSMAIAGTPTQTSNATRSSFSTCPSEFTVSWCLRDRSSYVGGLYTRHRMRVCYRLSFTIDGRPVLPFLPAFEVNAMLSSPHHAPCSPERSGAWRGRCRAGRPAHARIVSARVTPVFVVPREPVAAGGPLSVWLAVMNASDRCGDVLLSGQLGRSAAGGGAERSVSATLRNTSDAGEATIPPGGYVRQNT